MHSISRTPAFTNLHKRHQTDLEDPAAGKRVKAETEPKKQTGSDPTRISRASNFHLWESLNPKQPESARQINDVTGHMMAWLAEKDMLQLSLAGRHPQQTVSTFYLSRLKPLLKSQPDPTVFSYPYDGDVSAKWTIDQASLRKNTVRSWDRPEIVAQYTAQVHPHPSEYADRWDHFFRPPFGPRWEIVTIAVNRDSNTESGVGVETYQARLNPIGEHADHPAFLYRTAMNRRDRYIPTDQRGLDFLAAKKIYYPLTERIKNERSMTVAMAEQYIAERRRLIAANIASEELTPIQKGSLRNRLFAERVECSRLDLTQALALAGNEMNLFYCLTLLPLFRQGSIDLADVSMVSEPGIRFLHDLRLVKLFSQGVISKRQLTAMTQTQYTSISILYDRLLKRTESSKSVLALSSDQITELRKAGVLEDLAVGRITLARALLQISQEIETPLGSEVRFDGSSVLGKRKKLHDTLHLQRGYSLSSSSSSSSSFSSSSSSFPTSGTSTVRIRPAGPATMAREDVAMFLDNWPELEMSEVFYDESGKWDREWISSFQQMCRYFPALQKIRPAISQEKEDPVKSWVDGVLDSRTKKPDGDEFNTSSSLPPSLLTKEELLARFSQPISGGFHPTIHSLEQDEVPLQVVATFMSRLSPDTINEIIRANGFGGNADWVAAFGKIIHLMPVEKIIDFFSTCVSKGGEQIPVFDSFEDGLSRNAPKQVAFEFNQIFINLAQHLTAEDYLQVAEQYLDNTFGFMMSWSYRLSCSNLLEQCCEIWSLVQSRCVMTGTSIEKYADTAMESLKDGAWVYGFISLGSAHMEAMSSFGCCLVTMGLLENEEFLKMWTDNFFADESDFDSQYKEVDDHLGDHGMVNCQALFRRFLHFDYGARAHRFMDAAIERCASSN